jgi:hypothetical protein
VYRKTYTPLKSARNRDAQIVAHFLPTGEELMTFLYSTLSGPENVPALDASALLGIVRGLPRWDALIFVAENEQYPRLHVTWHEGHGFVVHCFEDGESWGFFLTEAAFFTSPEVEIEMGGQALEK